MTHVLIIGSGISGMACAVRCAEQGVHVTLASPFPSERSQSVMAAGGINAVLSGNEEGDTVSSHIEDTLKGGCGLGGERAVTGLCEHGEEILRWHPYSAEELERREQERQAAAEAEAEAERLAQEAAAALERENARLRAQVDALMETQQFLEDCLAEMAEIVYA